MRHQEELERAGSRQQKNGILPLGIQKRPDCFLCTARQGPAGEVTPSDLVRDKSGRRVLPDDLEHLAIWAVVERAVRDTSVSGSWEAGPAVMRALGVPTTESIPYCSGTGNASVTITRGTWDRSRTNMHEIRLPPGGSYTIPFTGRVGYNDIEFVNQSSIYSTGRIAHYWRSGTGSWNWWYTGNVQSAFRRTLLYSGSSDINYRFQITNTTSGYATFYWRFYTAW